MPITLEELQIKFIAETGALKSQLSGVQSQLAGLEQSAVKSQKTFGLFGKAAIVAGVVKAGKAMVDMGKEALLMANDVVESEQLFEVSMGNMEASARAWSESLSASLGLNAYDLRKNVGMLNVMFGSMGLGEQEAYDMSTSMVQLANDMASFYNLDTEEAFTKLRAGITGETEPLKRLGILVDEQTVAQYALKSGISKTGKELTQQQKLQARYGAIMEQTAKAQGDLARTMDSPTNQLRRLNAEFDMAKIALGQALQPALIAVLPHVTNFATGLTRMLKGGSGGDPLSGTINDLAGATAAIKSRVDMSIVDIVAEVARLQEGTEAAVDWYIQAASEVRDLYINISLKPQNNVYTRINKIFEELDSRVDTEASRAFKDGVKKKLDIILQDGVVTGPERQSLLDYLAEIEEELKEEAKKKLKAVQAEVKYKLETGEIDLPTADQMLIDAQAEYDESVGVIEGLIAEAKAEVGISDWTANTISADDRTKMTDAINKEIAAGEALLVSANAQVQALFEGSSLEQAVLGMYGELTREINKNNAEINELLTAWLDEDDGAAFEKAMAKREENKKLLAIASGGLTAEGKINKALLAIGGATPEEITNFAKGYKDIFGLMIEGRVELGKERENALLNMPDSYFAKQGRTRRQMIAENTAETNAAIAQANAMLLKSVTDALGPQIGKILKDPNASYDQTLDLSIAIDDLLSGIDIKGLDTAGIEQYDMLGAMLDGLDRLMRWQLTKHIAPFPDIDNPWQGGYAPEVSAPKGISPWKTGAVPEITIDRPRLTIEAPKSQLGDYIKGGESGGTSNVNVAVETSDVTLNIDGRAVASAVIKYLPKVQAQTGKPVYGGGGGGGRYFTIREL